MTETISRERTLEMIIDHSIVGGSIRAHMTGVQAKSRPNAYLMFESALGNMSVQLRVRSKRYGHYARVANTSTDNLEFIRAMIDDSVHFTLHQAIT